MADARLWEDGTGRRRWQPVSGRLALFRSGWWVLDCRHTPSLFRTRRAAVRAARRWERYRARSRWTPVSER